MADITIRNLENELISQLSKRATTNGRSMEEEARIILSKTLCREDSPTNFLGTVRGKLAEMGLSETDIDEAKAWARRAP